MRARALSLSLCVCMCVCVCVCGLIQGRMLSASDTLGAQQHGSDALHRMLRSGKKFVEEKDVVIVEDDTARMKLVLTGDAANADKSQDALKALVTGVVVLLEGVAKDDGCFHAHCVDFVKPEPQRPIAFDAKARADHADAMNATGDPLVALVSGLDIGNSSQLRLQLLIDFLCGHSGGDEDQQRSARVVRVVVAGGALSMTGNFRHAVSRRETRGDLKAWLREVDMTLSELASGVSVDVMPGEGEPTNHNLPQQPFHAMLLPGLAKYTTSARLATNPHCVTERGVSFIGTSGQNIRDVYRYSSLEDGLDLLEHTLRWGNLAPTAPDTLPCYPVADKDVFAMEEWPHVYFSGMMGEFGSRLVEGTDSNGGPCATRIVSVPDFSTTGQIAVINLRTLECDAMMFDAVEMDA